MPKPTLLSAALLIVSASLCGCSVVETLKERNAEAKVAKEARHMEVSKRNCSSYGFAAGTDALATCIQAEMNGLRNRDAFAEEARKTRGVIESSKPK